MSDSGKDTTDGARAESLAAAFLKAKGLKLLARNFRARGGEVDLVAREGRVTVFVEVRLRRSPGFGGAAASITAAKRQRLILAARYWLATRGESVCRFDCILLERLHVDAIEWVRNAFEA
jgi:putative endonuclease